jgi:hypothetical protein
MRCCKHYRRINHGHQKTQRPRPRT